MRPRRSFLALALLCAACAMPPTERGVVVFQSDFGLRDGAVSSMRAVAHGVDPGLRLENLTHEIPVFDIWEVALAMILGDLASVEVDSTGVFLTQDEMTNVLGLINESYDEGVPTWFVTLGDVD